MVVLGTGIPLLIIAAFNCIRFVPLRFVNVPNREYWFAGERREESLRWLGKIGVWLGCFLLVFLSVMHGLVVEANTHQPPHLDPQPLWLAVGVLAVGELALLVRIVLRFSKPAAS